MTNGRILRNLSDKWQDIMENSKIHGHMSGNMLSCQNRRCRDVTWYDSYACPGWEVEPNV